MILAGADFIEAKAAVGHGGFGQLLDALDIEPRMAQRLMAIARHRVLADPTRGSHLPPSWRTLSELSRLDDDDLAGAIGEGVVHPAMTRGDAARLVAGDREDEDFHGKPTAAEIAARAEPTPDSSMISFEEIFPDPQERKDALTFADASDDDFEGALAAGRAGGDLSRSNVRAKLEPAPSPPPGVGPCPISSDPPPTTWTGS